jgi:hypothetical protein
MVIFSLSPTLGLSSLTLLIVAILAPSNWMGYGPAGRMRKGNEQPKYRRVK